MSQNKVQGAGFEPVKQNVNFPHLEEEILKYWQEKNIVKKYLQKNNNSKEWNIDGIMLNPPKELNEEQKDAIKKIIEEYKEDLC